MKKPLLVIITVCVCLISSFLFFSIPQEARILLTDPSASSIKQKDGPAVDPAGGLLYFVNTTSDTVVVGACANGNAGCSLRGAILQANTNPNADEIEISVAGTINLTSALPDITTNMSIVGPGPANLTVRRNTGGEYRIFQVTFPPTVVNFSGMTISNGRTNASGGGIFVDDTNVTITNCAITDNFASLEGGGFYGTGIIEITNSAITNNLAGLRGGGIQMASPMTISNSTISSNRTNGQGGGIYTSAFALNITNSTIAGNIASSAGGGIRTASTDLSVGNSTITGNIVESTVGTGGGIYTGVDQGNTYQITSSIIALNVATTQRDLGGNSSFGTGGYNLFGVGEGTSFPAATNQRGTIASPLDPLLDPAGLQNNGGPTRTIAPLSNSPAIDKGTSSSLTTDQRGTGFPRTVDNPAVSNAAGGNGTDIGAFERGRKSTLDFDGDGKTDIGIFRPAGGASEWWINRSSTGQTFALQFGASTDRIAPADYTGDGKADVAIFRPLSGEWYVLRSEDFSFFALPFGTNGDIPAPADYDADGKADFTIFRPSSSTWFVSQSSGAPTRIVQFGTAGDRPVVADYDGDGKADIGIFRQAASGAEWWIDRSTAGLLAMQFGVSTDKAVQGDYTGDGRTDIAIWRPSTGEWFIVRSENFSFYGFPFGTTGDVVAPGDYDGDGKFDVTVFRPSSATWFVSRTTAGTQIVQFGSNGDRPLPNAFVP